MKMADTVRGLDIRRTGRFDHWFPILEEWILCTERFSRLWDGQETSYLHKEISTVGSLAAAAWKAGFIASQEVRFDKKHGRGTRLGRGDLYIGSNSIDEWIEAKFKWIPISKNPKINNYVEKVLGSALQSASECRQYKDEYISGCAIFGIRSKTRELPKIDEYIETMINDFLRQKLPVIAWCFPRENRRAVLGEHICPGVIVAIEDEAVWSSR